MGKKYKFVELFLAYQELPDNRTFQVSDLKRSNRGALIQALSYRGWIKKVGKFFNRHIYIKNKLTSSEFRYAKRFIPK